MDTDLGYEFPDGNFVSDVLLRSASTIDFPCEFSEKRNNIIEKEPVMGMHQFYAYLWQALMFE